MPQNSGCILQRWLLRTRVQEVIPMRRKAYRATVVNRVDEVELTKGRDGLSSVVGIDQGKYELFAVVRWSNGQFERPWRVANPEHLPELIALLRRLGQGRSMTVALE